LARPLQEEKVVFRVLCILFFLVAYLNKVPFREITLYSMERETSLRHIRAALDHNSSKITEIYTRVLAMNTKSVGYYI
jgi:hypothetical protein